MAVSRRLDEPFGALGFSEFQRPAGNLLAPKQLRDYFAESVHALVLRL